MTVATLKTRSSMMSLMTATMNSQCSSSSSSTNFRKLNIILLALAIVAVMTLTTMKNDMLTINGTPGTDRQQFGARRSRRRRWFYSSTRDDYEPRSEDDQTLTEFYERTGDYDPVNVKLGDGCYHVFLDVGSNIGVHVRFLMESQHYPKSKGAVKIFEDLFGSERDNRDFCIFSFEPNPVHRRRHTGLRDAYKSMGWKYMPIQAGVSNQDGGNITFYHLGDTKHEEVGFTMMKPPPGSKDAKHSTSIDVPVVRLSSWIQRHIYGRKLPDIVYGHKNGDDDKNAQQQHRRQAKVVMKLDIEGMEYVTVPDLFYNDNCLCKNVDYVMGEEHHWLERLFPMNMSGLSLENGKQANDHLNQILEQIKTTPDCKTDFNFLDDEAYMHDARPFPSPPR